MAPLKISLVFGLLLASALALPKKLDDKKAASVPSTRGNFGGFGQPQIQPGHGGGFGGFGQPQIQPGHGGGFGGFGQPQIQPGHGGGFGGFGQPQIQPGHGGGFGGFGQPQIQPVHGGGFGGNNQGFGQQGGFARPQTATCRFWCKTPEGQAYCCESNNKAPKHPITSLIKKPGNCPVPRAECPIRSFGFQPPNPCSKHGDCAGADRCCFDRCLSEHVCKAPLFHG